MDYVKYKVQLVKESSFEYSDKSVSSFKIVEKLLINDFQLDKECEEVVLLISLDVKLNIIGVFEISRGIINASMIHPREVFKRLVLNNASSFVIAHNHPSGDNKPSSEDIKTCNNIKSCSEIMGIDFIDFLIVGDKVLSFRKEQLL